MSCTERLIHFSYEKVVAILATLLVVSIPNIALSIDLKSQNRISKNYQNLFSMTGPDGQVTVCMNDNGRARSVEKELNHEKLKDLQTRIKSSAGEKQARLRNKRKLLRKRILDANALCERGSLLLANASTNYCVASDLNHDNAVDGTDLSILLAHMGRKSKIGDIDQNRIVDIIDLSILLANIGCDPSLPGEIDSSSPSSSSRTSQSSSAATSSVASSAPMSPSSSSRSSSSSSSSISSSSNASAQSVSVASSRSSSSAQSSAISSSRTSSQASSVSSSSGTNLPPTADPKSVTVTQNMPIPFTLTGSDPEGRPLTFTITSQPSHGTISGIAPYVSYTPQQNYLGQDTFRFRVSDGANLSPEAPVVLTVSTFMAPIGIPNPPLISASHTMYAGQRFDFNQNGILESNEGYRDYGNGPVTHIVDNSSPGSIHGPTNPDWPYGSLAHPLREIPPNPPAGSVIEVRGGPYNYGGQGENLIAPRNGTIDKPIFFRGINYPQFIPQTTICAPNEHPVPNHTGGCDYVYRSQYAIFEGFNLAGFHIAAAADHIVLRNSNVSGRASSFGGIDETLNGVHYDNPTHDIVFYQNVIHDNGDINADYDQDSHGTKVSQNIYNFWILNSEYFRNSGDGVQVGNNAFNSSVKIDRGYIGGNLIYGNKQTGVAGKGSSNIIVSQNTVHSHRPMGSSPSAWGSGMGFQYGPENWWFLYNHIYNCTNGITVASANDGTGREVYIIGNVIHDIDDQGWETSNPTESGWGWSAIGLRSTANRHIINNTMYNVLAGVNLLNGINLEMKNNIVANVTSSLGEHFFEEGIGTLQNVDMENNIFYQPNGSVRMRWDNWNYTLPQFITNTHECSTCRETDPMFVAPGSNDFHLRTGSPAINSGDSTYAGSVYETFDRLYPEVGGILVDFDRHPRQGALDIGAFEY